MLKGNKGEWSEIYVLLRLLADGKIFAADENLNRLNDIYFPIIKIIREEIKDEINEYMTGQTVKLFVNGIETIALPAEKFDAEADKLLSNIQSEKKRGAFSIEKTEQFMNEINCFKLSAPATNKSDITMKILDVNTGYDPVVGFSIKSELGSAPTLLNAGRTTNFIYKTIHEHGNLLEETNKIYITTGNKRHTDVRGRISKIYEKGGLLVYHGMQNKTFKDNLVLIDSNMDKIIAETLLYFYRDGTINCYDMVEKLKKKNPMNFGNIYAYSYKFKNFLTSVALGMRPATVWDGIDEASGGYIIVTREGDVLAYHIYNRNYFEEYLLRNVKYETASTSRHNFGELYTVDDETFIKLNLQIRFIK